jgi:outer membrane lipoprotein-sorting protein
MTSFIRRPSFRWLAPLLAAVVFIGAGSAIATLTASAGDVLAPRSASQLLVDVQNARLSGLSGTIVQNSDLGIPALPGVDTGQGSSDLTSLVSGSHTLRLWYAGPDHVRLALLGQLGESDVIRNGSDLWTWSSGGRSATHRVIPASPTRSHPSTGATTPSMTPQQAADAALQAITPTTSVSTDATTVVAGRSAYVLDLRPRTSDTLVDSVQIAIDGQTHIPTRVQVFAKGLSSPAFEVGFTAFDPTTPSMSVFGFNPPPGTTVTEEPTSAGSGIPDQQAPAQAAGAKPQVVGSGWTSVLVGSLPAGQTNTSSGTLGAMLKLQPQVSGTWGSGRLLQGTLFSVLLTDDGTVVAGAVPPRLLYDALAAR